MKGSCLCAAIEYEIDSIDLPVAHNHCRTCQKACSLAVVAMMNELLKMKGSKAPL